MSGGVVHINSYFWTNSLHGELLVALDRIGIEQLAFVPVRSELVVAPFTAPALAHGELRTVRVGGGSASWCWPLRAWSSWQVLDRLLSAARPSLIHAHTLITNGVLAYGAKKRWGIPYVVTVRNTDVHTFLGGNRVFRRLGELILDEAEAITTLSPAYRDQHLARLLSPRIRERLRDRIFVIPNGIHDEWFHSPRAPLRAIDSGGTILFVGRVTANKNLVSLVRACDLLHERGRAVTIEVAGDGPELDTARAAAIHTPVIAHGFISDRERLRTLYRKADLLVVPSFKESFGLVYAEAMSQGVPVLYSQGQGFDGHFPDGMVGLPVNPQSYHDIADRIEWALDHRGELSSRALDQAKMFSWDRVASELGDLYRRCSGGGKA